MHDTYAIAIMNDDAVVRHLARKRVERAPGDQAAENFGGLKFCRKLTFVFLIFIAGWTDKNILTPKISRFTVHTCIYIMLHKHVRVGTENANI